MLFSGSNDLGNTAILIRGRIHGVAIYVPAPELEFNVRRIDRSIDACILFDHEGDRCGQGTGQEYNADGDRRYCHIGRRRRQAPSEYRTLPEDWMPSPHAPEKGRGRWRAWTPLLRPRNPLAWRDQRLWTAQSSAFAGCSKPRTAHRRLYLSNLWMIETFQPGAAHCRCMYYRHSA